MSLRHEYFQDIGISTGQWLTNDQQAFKNANWYNQDAELVGVGDIGIDQPDTISQRLVAGEIFAVVESHKVGESWRPSIAARVRRQSEEKPGHGFIAHEFALLIMPRSIYLPGEEGAQFRIHHKLGELATVSPKRVLSWMKKAQDLKFTISSATDSIILAGYNGKPS